MKQWWDAQYSNEGDAKMSTQTRTLIALGALIALVTVGTSGWVFDNDRQERDLTSGELSRITGMQPGPDDCYLCELDHLEGTPDCVVGNPCQGCTTGNGGSGCASQAILTTGMTTIEVFRTSFREKTKWLNNVLLPCQYLYYCFSDPTGFVPCETEGCGTLFDPLGDCYNCQVGAPWYENKIQAKECVTCPW